MLVSTFSGTVFAESNDLNTQDTNTEGSVTATELKGKVEGNKEVFTFELPERQAQRRARRAAPLNQGNDTIVNLTAVGLNGGAFDWSALPNSEFKLTAKWKTADGQEHSKVFATINAAGETQYYVGWPVDGTLAETASIEADFDQSIMIRVTYNAGNGTGIPGGLLFNITITELAEPRANVEYVDPYGRKLENTDLPTGTMPKVTADELTDVEIDLPNSSKEINMRESELIDEDELNTAANGLTFKVDNKSTGETVTIDNKEYKLDISAPNAKQIGTIKMIYQKDVIVPPTDNNGGPVTPADGYVRLTFDANENKQDGITGTHNNGLYAGKQKSYIDVKEGLDYTNANLQAAIKELSTTGTKEVNGETKTYGQDAKNPWTPVVPTDTTAVAEATYNAQYTKSKAEQVQELGGLNPKTIKVWKDDPIDWKNGVEPADKNSDAAWTLIEEATVTDITVPARDSSNSGKFPGKLKLSFDDGSSLEVDKQMLIVSEHVVVIDPNNTDPDAPKEEDLPSGKVKVFFEAKPNGGVESITTKGTTFAKIGTVLQDKDFPQNKDITFKDGYKGPVTWTPEKTTPVKNSGLGFVKGKGFVFKASATQETTAEEVTELGGLSPETIKVWVKDQIDWSKGVKATTEANKDKVAALLKDATVTDKTDPARTSETAGKYEGTLLVTFKDKSTLEVAKQMLIVSDNKVVDPQNPEDLPDNKIKVEFAKGTGVTAVAEKNLYVKPGTELVEADFPQATVDTANGYKEPAAWTPEDKVVTENNKKFTATATKDVPTTKNSEDYDPHYTDKSGKPGDTVQIDPPTFTKKGEQGTVSAPSDGAKKTTFAKNDNKQTNVTVDSNTGAITVVIPQDAKVGDTITIPVDVTYPDGSTETVRVTVTVTDKDKSATPTIDQPTEGDDKITGKGEPEAEIVVKDKDGNEIGKTTVDKDGNWLVTVPADKPLKKNDVITATQTEKGKKPSDPARETVKGKLIPPSFNYLTLTLDENYRGGEITHHDVYEDELIERYLYTPRRRGYVFEGWSYRSDYLDEVRPGDRIYYSTTLYAIWSKDRYYDRDEREEEPEDTREVLEHKAYMFGYTDGTVRPNGRITRAEAAALVTRLLGIESIGAATKPMFTDTPSAWYNKAINAAVQRGIMKGYPDGRFRPNAPITRAEFTQMIAQIDNKPYGIAPFADVKGHWAELAIGREYQAKRIMGYPDGTFRPNAHITRCEAVVILNKMFERNYDDMSANNAMNRHLIKSFLDLSQSFWGYNDMVEATNSHDFKRRVKGRIEEDWTLVK